KLPNTPLSPASSPESHRSLLPALAHSIGQNGRAKRNCAPRPLKQLRPRKPKNRLRSPPARRARAARPKLVRPRPDAEFSFDASNSHAVHRLLRLTSKMSHAYGRRVSCSAGDVTAIGVGSSALFGCFCVWSTVKSGQKDENNM